MNTHFNKHGLVYYKEDHINWRNYAVDTISKMLQDFTRSINSAWVFKRFEGTILMPQSEVSDSYSQDDYFKVNNTDFVLSPETTQSTYEIARNILKSNAVRMPFCAWQVKKSFRNENKHSSGSLKELRFLEFYQMEFQMLFSKTTKAEYYEPIIDKMKEIFNFILGAESVEFRDIPSDRIPSYAEHTQDIEVRHKKREKFKEICSISKRKDFSDEVNNIEVAIGLDRLVWLKFEEK